MERRMGLFGERGGWLHVRLAERGCDRESEKLGQIFKSGGKRSTSRCNFDKQRLFSLTRRLHLQTGPRAYRSWASGSYFKWRDKCCSEDSAVRFHLHQPPHNHSSHAIFINIREKVSSLTATWPNLNPDFHNVTNMIWGRGLWIYDFTNPIVCRMSMLYFVYFGMRLSIH